MPRASSKGCRYSANIGVWKPVRNGSTCPSTRWAFSRSWAIATDASDPHTMTWCGQLSCDTAMSGRPAIAASATSTPHPSARNTRSGSTRSPSAMPRTKRSMASRVTAPATSIAVHSPRLWPTTTSGRTCSSASASVSSRPTYMMPAPCRSRSDDRGTSSASTPKCAATSSTRASNAGSTPGKANATCPPPAIRPSGANHTSLRPRQAWPRSTTLRASSTRFGVGSAMASRSRPGAPSDARSVPASTASASASWAATAARSSPVATNSGWRRRPRRAPAAGRRRRGRPQRSAGASSAAPRRRRARRGRAANGSAPDDPGATPSRMTWALMPPNPKALMPTRRGAPSSSHGRAARTTSKRLGSRSGCGSSQCSVGGRTRWCRASAALISPAIPLAGMAWPIIDFTEPSPTGGCALAVVVLEDVAQGGDLDAVAGAGGRAVGLDQADAGRVELGGLPGPLDGQHLPLAGGAHQRGGPAVARHAGAADRGVDPVAVAAGVGQALEHHDPGALADEDAVGGLVERADQARGAERPELGEHAPQGHVVAVVHAAGQHQVGSARLQLGDRLRHRQQRGRAGGVERVGGAPEVEAVGDERGHQVRHQADRRLGVRRAEGLLELVADGVELVVAQVGHQLAQAGDELLGGAHPLLEPRRGRREVAAPPEDDADALRVGHALDVAGVGERPGRGRQGQELVGLGTGGGDRHDAEVGGVEGHGRVDEPAPPAVEAVGSRRPGLEEDRVDPIGGTSVTASTPWTRLSQKAARSEAPGKIPAIPTTAIGSVATVSRRGLPARRTSRPPAARVRPPAARPVRPPPPRRGR